MENNLSNKYRLDMMTVAKRLWSKRRFLLVVVGSFMAFGLFIALFSPKVYTANCVFVPQRSKKTNSSLSSLAAMAGINLNEMGSSAETISPYVYPKVLDNIDYQKELMYSKIKFDNIAEPISLLDYYTNPEYKRSNVVSIVLKYTIGLPRVIINALKGDRDDIESATNEEQVLKQYSSTEFDCISVLRSNITMIIDEKSGYLTLSVQMPEAHAAAEVAQRAFDLLQKYITDFKLEKVQANLDFIQGRYDETKADFDAKQLALAEFKDANRALTSNTVATKLEQMTTEYNMAKAMYMEVSKQLLQAGIQVKEDTPILTAVKPVSVPFKRSQPKRVQILFIFTFLGCVVSCGAVMGIDWLKSQGSTWPKSWN